jgi:hypothetical protein
VGIRNSHVRRPRSGQVCEFPPRTEQRKEPRSGPDFGSPFLWVLSFGEAKEQYLGRRGETRPNQASVEKDK